NFNILKPVLLYTYDSKNKLIESIAGLIQSSFQKFSEQWRISIILFFILFGFGLFVTFSRSAWLIALMGVMLVGILSDRISFPKLSHGRWLTIATALLMVMVIVGPLVISRFLALETTDVLSIDRRVQLMNVAWELWR